jgi:hypothetical protein
MEESFRTAFLPRAYEAFHNEQKVSCRAMLA